MYMYTFVADYMFHYCYQGGDISWLLLGCYWTPLDTICASPQDKKKEDQAVHRLLSSGSAGSSAAAHIVPSHPSARPAATREAAVAPWTGQGPSTAPGGRAWTVGDGFCHSK